MGRMMALDIGQKRVGVAVSDELRIIATPLTTVHVDQLLSFISDYIAREKLDGLVVGEPKDLSGHDSDASTYIKPMLKRLRKAFPQMAIESYDERFTSRMAFQSMIDGGVPMMQRRDKAMVDKISAAIILRDFLEYDKRRNS